MKNASHVEAGDRCAEGMLNRAAAMVRRKSRRQASLGIVLGSGFDDLRSAIREKVELPYSRLPGLPVPTVAGHAGTLLSGVLGDAPVIVLSGRAHYYEGHSMEAVTMGVRLLARLGVKAVLITNAAGGLHRRFRVGDFMLLTDHINLMGVNPLRGTRGHGNPGFVDMACAYDRALCALLRRAARRSGVSLRQGVYLAVSGPSYETPAEIRAFRRLGADAVGMSTVPEVLVARQSGLRVAAVSCITNLAAGMGEGPLDHRDVLKAGARASRSAARLIEHFAGLYQT